MRRRGYRCVNSLQTNGILLDEEWIDFLRDNAFGVGSSLDGLPELHDARRRDRHNRPTYDAVVRNLQKAKERGLPIGVICVINRDTVPHVEAIYENLKSLGLPFTMSPVTPNHGQTLAAQPLTPEEYTEVLIRLFDVWFDDPHPTVPVNPPHSILQGIIYGGMPFYCSTDDSCFSKFVSFLPDGSVYPCNRFAGEPSFFLGNILEESLGAILYQRSKTGAYGSDQGKAGTVRIMRIQPHVPGRLCPSRFCVSRSYHDAGLLLPVVFQGVFLLPGQIGKGLGGGGNQ